MCIDAAQVINRGAAIGEDALILKVADAAVCADCFLFNEFEVCAESLAAVIEPPITPEHIRLRAFKLADHIDGFTGLFDFAAIPVRVPNAMDHRNIP